MEKEQELSSLYASCALCPRACGVNRLKGQTGFCRQGRQIKLAYSCLHKGEEPPLCGAAGSGTLFFSGCTLKCSSCQNYQLSGEGMGAEVTEREVADIMCALQKLDACNINLVTGSHFIPGIINALKQARKRGMTLPVVWNTSGYETPAALELLDPYVDIYLADVKTLDEGIADRLCSAPDYPRNAAHALKQMAAAKPLRWNNRMLAQGVIMRHLILPGELQATEQVLAWYKDKLDKQVLLSLMTQFIPISADRKTEADRSRETAPVMFGRKLAHSEYKQVMKLLDTYGIEEGFFQEPSRDDAWLPDFSTLIPFPERFARPVWHYSQGHIDETR
ncbi:MAG: radical SAM protein [Spirochaetales bacterium]|nr:radical SAM protein [Spirochaetales bacterium]